MSEKKKKNLLERLVTGVVEKVGFESVLLEVMNLTGWKLDGTSKTEIKTLMKNTLFLSGLALAAKSNKLEAELKKERDNLKKLTTSKSGTKELKIAKEKLKKIEKEFKACEKDLDSKSMLLEVEIIKVLSLIPKLKDMPMPKHNNRTPLEYVRG